MVLRLGAVLLFLVAAPIFSQAPAPVPEQATDAGPVQAEVIPERTLKFSPVDSGSAMTVSPVTALPQCDTEGYLFLDMLDAKDLKKHTLVSFRGKENQTYLPSAISDLHDINIFGFFPKDLLICILQPNFVLLICIFSRNLNILIRIFSGNSYMKIYSFHSLRN